MNSRSLLAGSALVTTMALWGVWQPALAAPINLMGYTGPISIKFENYESFGNLGPNGTLQTGSTNFGVFQITSIQAGTTQGGILAGQDIWTPGGANGFLVGTFDNITVTAVINGGTATENTGGNFAIYQTAALPNFALGTGSFIKGGCDNAAGCYTGLSGAPGTSVLDFNLVPGSDKNNAADTLFATINNTTVPLQGDADGYANIVGGTDASQFGKAGFTTADNTKADLQISDRFCPNPIAPGSPACNGISSPGVGNWSDLSEDPVGASTSIAVPEPATLALVGGGLLGLGMMRRRRRQKA